MRRAKWAADKAVKRCSNSKMRFWALLQRPKKGSRLVTLKPSVYQDPLPVLSLISSVTTLSKLLIWFSAKRRCTERKGLVINKHEEIKHTLTGSSVNTLLNGLDGLNGISGGDGKQGHCWVNRSRVVGKEVVWVVGWGEKQKEGKRTSLYTLRKRRWLIRTSNAWLTTFSRTDHLTKNIPTRRHNDITTLYPETPSVTLERSISRTGS